MPEEKKAWHIAAPWQPVIDSSGAAALVVKQTGILLKGIGAPGAVKELAKKESVVTSDSGR